MCRIMPHTITANHESMNASPPDLEEPTPFIRRRPVRLIIYAGLGLFVLIMVIWPLIAQLKDPDFQKHIAEHRVMVGMSKEQVLAAWGGPQTINTTFTKEGLRREEWIFEDWESAAVVKHRYLHFEEGILNGGWFQGSGERLPIQSPSNPHSPKPRNSQHTFPFSDLIHRPEKNGSRVLQSNIFQRAVVRRFPRRPALSAYLNHSTLNIPPPPPLPPHTSRASPPMMPV